jgi:nucleoid-associated protein YgaU/DNA-binding SARP family transcriptional activator
VDAFKRTARVLSALATLVILGVGLPVALIRWGQWPVSGVPTLDQISDLPSTIVTDSSLFGVLTVAAWAVWAAFLGSVVVEVAATVKGHPGVDLPLCGPLQRLVRPLVASVVMSVSATGSLGAPLMIALVGERPALAIELPAQPVTVSPRLASLPVPTPAVAPPPDLAMVEVQADDTYWGLAERALGDGFRWREIRDFNVGRRMPDGSTVDTSSNVPQPGWVLALPAAAAPMQAPLGPPPDPVPDATEIEVAETDVVVQVGDSMWRISEGHLADALGRTPTTAEVADFCGAFVELNSDQFVQPGNADLIYPGQTFVLPDMVMPTAPSAVVSPVPAPALPDESTAAEIDSPDTTAASAAPPSSSVEAPGTVPSTTSSSQPQGVDTPRVDETDPGDDPDSSVLPAGVVALATSTTVAVGLTAAIRRRRRQRNHLVPTVAPQPTTDESLHRELLEAADEDAVDTLVTALDSLASGLVESGLTCRPLIVQHGPIHTDVFLDQATTPAVDGWQAIGQGAVWAHDTVSPTIAINQRWSSPAPLLVTLGQPDADGQIYLDLEAARLTSITGDRVIALDLLRTFAVELAHSPLAETAQVFVVGELGASGLLDRCEQVTVIDSWDVVADEIAEWASQSRSALEDLGLANPFAARAADPEDDALAPLVVFAADPPETAGVLDFLHGGPSTVAAVVVSNEHMPGATVVDCSSDALRLPQFDLTCVPQILEDEQVDRMAQLLVDASDPSGDQLALILDAGPPGNGSEPSLEPAMPYEDPSYEVLVRFLGDITIEGDLRRRLRPKETSAVAFVALNGPVTVDRVEDALWASPTCDTRRRRLVNVMSQCRAVIGKEHLRSARGGHYEIGPGVATDLELFDRRIQAAAAEPRREVAADLVLSALKLSSGQLFHTRSADTDSFSWVEASNLMSHWELKITKLAQELAESCLDHADTARAIAGCEAGLLVMPTHTGCTEALMRAHAANGDPAAVQHVYQAHVRSLELIHLDQAAESTVHLFKDIFDSA